MCTGSSSLGCVLYCVGVPEGGGSNREECHPRIGAWCWVGRRGGELQRIGDHGGGGGSGGAGWGAVEVMEGWGDVTWVIRCAAEFWMNCT